jgi:quercetin dioxygenase-like cupin family protein
MKHTRIAEVEEQEAVHPLFTGTVTRQDLVPLEQVHSVNCGVVNFPRGVRNKFHAHSGDQVLVITAGIGIVATETEQVEASVGDVVHIPAGEKHWHGARKESPMSHITITLKDSTTKQLED